MTWGELAELWKTCNGNEQVVVMLGGRSYALKSAERIHVNCIEDNRKSGRYIELTPDIEDFNQLAIEMRNREERKIIETILKYKLLSGQIMKGVSNLNCLACDIRFLSRKIGEGQDVADQIFSVARWAGELNLKLNDRIEELARRIGLNLEDRNG